MRYEILGGLRVVASDNVWTVSARKMETLLAALVIRSDTVVSSDELIHEIWGEKPPRRATATLHVYVSQLRKLLARHGSGGSQIITRSPGYTLRTESDQIDVLLFQGLMNDGRSALRTGRLEEASRLLREALGLWRGAVPYELREGPIVNAFAAWAEQARLECIDLSVDVDLELGLHHELVSRLYTLVAENPLHESLYRQIMLALYRCERRADALAVYRQARSTLNRELGLEPSRTLQELHQSILKQGDRLALPAAV
ncbi:AfsR/SARP family transcriptional regulator [Nocardiopsis exhalans]|uniref:AfsR/SARP family transcriptional regulator n=1 Tax=Nocardiopsis exhalans TaxID=163604 RepID=A0ABY5D3T5_9ACTN|nr:AfsR/SARP family transcriptional regulator [Nocardiopsis exhalans]USY18411.1 AfsR/SARP family transcriptional regulator [Nocardiopsis exhalans]